MNNKTFLQIGLWIECELAYLLKEGWYGYGVDFQPSSLITSIDDFFNNGKLNVYKDNMNFISLGIGDTFGLDFARTDYIISPDSEATLGFTQSPNKKYSYMIYKITLDMLLASIPNKVDFLAIDIEGGELEVFKNYNWVSIPSFLLIEYHSNDIKIFLEKIIENIGYKPLLDCTYKIAEGGVNILYEHKSFRDSCNYIIKQDIFNFIKEKCKNIKLYNNPFVL